MVLLEIIGMTIVNHWPLGRRVLNWGRRIGIFDGVEHGVEEMRPDYNVTRSDFRHGLLRWIFALDLLPLRLLRLRPVSYQNSVTEPFPLRPFQGG